jgi:hypothetical protein
MVAHACNPSYAGGREKSIIVQGQYVQKAEKLSENNQRKKGLG